MNPGIRLLVPMVGAMAILVAQANPSGAATPRVQRIAVDNFVNTDSQHHAAVETSVASHGDLLSFIGDYTGVAIANGRFHAVFPAATAPDPMSSTVLHQDIYAYAASI